MQNKSHAVMAQRVEVKDSLDNFPTPPWATRALIEYVIEKGNKEYLNKMSCLEPACGAGHMSKTLKEYFGCVKSSDIFPYGYGEVEDFLNNTYLKNQFDWIITNPPFKHAEYFIEKSLNIAKRGVAMLVRTVFIESVGRYDRIFSISPPQKFAQFSERVPMVKGRLDAKASTATGYAWIVWEKNVNYGSQLLWIPPCRRILEHNHDYEETLSSHTINTYEEAALNSNNNQKKLL